MTERQSFRTLSTGFVIGAVEVVVASSFAGLVFSGLLKRYVADGIGLYLAAASITLALMAWRAGTHAVVGSLQPVTPAVLAILATPVALNAFGSGAGDFVTVVFATMVITVVVGITCVALGIRRRGDLVRFVPYPVVGGFLAGVGWLLVVGGIAVTVNESPFLLPIADLLSGEAFVRWAPAVLFGGLLLVAPRVVSRPFTVPFVVAVGFVAYCGVSR